MSRTPDGSRSGRFGGATAERRPRRALSIARPQEFEIVGVTPVAGISVHRKPYIAAAALHLYVFYLVELPFLPSGIDDDGRQIGPAVVLREKRIRFLSAS